MREISVSRPELKALLERIGGEPKLREILSDFYRRMAADILLMHFFIGKDLEHIASMQAEFLLRAMGARLSYKGKPPAQAHEQLADILSGHFDRRLRILEGTLRDHGVAAEDIRIWVAFESTFREGIVGPEGLR